MPQGPPTATRRRVNKNARPFVVSGRGSASPPASAANSSRESVQGSLGSIASPPQHIGTGKHVCPVGKKHVSGSNARTA